jgi:membrane protease YdiL (CAAX protease family)
MGSPESRKLILVLAILVIATNVFAALLLWLLVRQVTTDRTLLVMGGTYYELLPLLFVFLELLIVAWIYGPLRRILSLDASAAPRHRSYLEMTLAGICSGLGLLILFVPLLLRSKPDRGLVSLIVCCSTSLPAFVAAGLGGIALPVAGEIVFKGVILKTLLRNISFPWSLLITSFSFALMWPIFNGYWLALGLGAVTCLLYYRYRFLVPSIIADVTFTVGVYAFLTFRVLLHF